MQIPLKVSKVYFFDINHGLTMTLWTFFTKSKNYAIPMYGLQYPWSRKAMDKGKIEAMVTKFSEKFAIIMLKKHRKFCRCGLTHLDATPTFQKSFRSFWVTLYISPWLPDLAHCLADIPQNSSCCYPLWEGNKPNIFECDVSKYVYKLGKRRDWEFLKSWFLEQGYLIDLQSFS